MLATHNAAHLIERNIKAHTSHGYTAAHMVQDAHERTIRELCADLALLTGQGQRPQSGCEIASKCLGDSEVLVEYEFDKGQRGRLYGPPENCCEEIEPSVTVIQVFVNGQWIDADCINEAIVERWQQELVESSIEDAVEVE